VVGKVIVQDHGEFLEVRGVRVWENCPLGAVWSQALHLLAAASQSVTIFLGAHDYVNSKVETFKSKKMPQGSPLWSGNVVVAREVGN
jgi:hypothetical protein